VLEDGLDAPEAAPARTAVCSPFVAASGASRTGSGIETSPAAAALHANVAPSIKRARTRKRELDIIEFTTSRTLIRAII
jgi:hypothetical protein